MPDRPGLEDTQVQVILFFTNETAAIDLDKALVIYRKDALLTGGLILLKQGPLGGPRVGVIVVLSVIIHSGDNINLPGSEMTTFQS